VLNYYSAAHQSTSQELRWNLQLGPPWYRSLDALVWWDVRPRDTNIQYLVPFDFTVGLGPIALLHRDNRRKYRN